MITYFTIEDYFGEFLDHPDKTQEVFENAQDLLRRVNMVCEVADMDGVDFLLNPKTQSYVSGQKYGGFRPQDCPVGAAKSSHKEGKAIDIYDARLRIADWFMKHPAVLAEHGLYMEHASKTPRWAHLTTRSPKSGKRIFQP